MKKGLMVFSDMVWFLLFIITAALIFYSLFRPLIKDIDGKVDVGTIDTEGRGLQSDAAFIATTLPRMKNNEQRFSDTLRDLVKARGDSGLTVENVPQYAAYIRFLDEIISGERGLYDTNHPQRVQAIAIVLRNENAYYYDTCIEYGNQGRKKSGERLLICNKVVDNSVFSSGLDSLGVMHDKHIERGFSYIPTEQEVITLEVLMYYEESP